MAEIESERQAWKSGLLTILLLAALLATLIFNALFMFVFARSKKLRRAPNLFLLNLAVVDLLTAVFWLLPAIVASAQWQWKLGGPLCRLHGFVGMFGFSMNMFTLSVIAFEKFLKIFAPSRHSDAFYNYTITMIVVVSLWLLSLVVSFMPLVGWGRIKFFDYQLQCVTDYVESVTHLNFYFVNAFCLPLVVMVALYLATLVRIRVLKSKGTTSGKIVLQQRSDTPGESFAEKMRRQQEKFKYNNKSDANATSSHVNDETEQNVSDVESDDYASDENEVYQDYEEYRLKKQEREMARRRKKVYAFRQQYLFMSLTMIVVTCIYVALWLPFFIVTYTWVHDPDDVKEAGYTTFSVISFFGASYKPLIYVFNKHIRLSVKQAFTRSKKTTKKHLTPDFITKYKPEEEEAAGKKRPASGGTAQAANQEADADDSRRNDLDVMTL